MKSSTVLNWFVVEQNDGSSFEVIGASDFALLKFTCSDSEACQRLKAILSEVSADAVGCG